MAPKTAYLLLEDQPAMRMARTARVEKARISTIPTFRSLMIRVREKGITRKESNTGRKMTMGASRKTGRSTSSGVMSSLPMSFRASATVCTAPWGPTSMGPRRSCMWAETLRSIQMRNRAFTATRAMTPMRPMIILPASVAQYCANSSIIPPSERLAVDFRDHQVHRAQDGHQVGHQGVHRHLGEDAEIAEGRHPEFDAVGFDIALADDIAAEFAPGAFHRLIDLTRGGFQTFGHL